jgi:glutaredoxin
MAMRRTDLLSRPACWRALALVAALGSVALPAAAQYKVVGPDGRVTYTDRPPADSTVRVTPLGRESTAPATVAQDALPQDLRQASSRFPVTLYATADCAPCDAGRQLLLQRGVPFTEKFVVSEDDAMALEQLTGARTVPSLTIGAQVLRGLSQSEWASYLDLAGYPRESRLPKGWQAPASAPLVARTAPRVPSAPAVPAAPRAPARSVPPAAAEVAPAPGGIRF